MGIFSKADTIESQLAPKEEVWYFEIEGAVRNDALLEPATALAIAIVESHGAVVVRTDHRWDDYDPIKRPLKAGQSVLTVYVYYTAA